MAQPVTEDKIQDEYRRKTREMREQQGKEDKAREDALGLTEVPVAPGAAPAKKPETEDDGIDDDEYSAPPNPPNP